MGEDVGGRLWTRNIGSGYLGLLSSVYTLTGSRLLLSRSLIKVMVLGLAASDVVPDAVLEGVSGVISLRNILFIVVPGVAKGES